ncbi:MAG: hypothetical protein ABIT76_10780 [Chthoniobacterales bacterium]
MATGNRRRKIRPREKSTLLRSSIALEQRAPLTIPSRWLKFVIALFLLPIAWIATEAFFNCFSAATLQHRFWATEEFWFFGLGVVLWMIAFLGLPKPLLVYVYGHELTHAVWVWIMGGRVSHFEATSEGGHIITDKSNFLIALAPYFFPIYSLLTIAVWGAVSLFHPIHNYHEYLFALIGMTWGFHLTFTLWMIPKGQSDLTEHGTFFSLVVIYLMNLLLLATFLIVASPHVGLHDYLRESLRSTVDFSVSVRTLVLRFLR